MWSARGSVRDAASAVGSLAARLLPLWFAGWTSVRVWQLGFLNPGPDLSWLGRDFRIYRDGAVALLGGASPWSAFDTWNGRPWHFAAAPTAAQAFVPFALVPEGVGAAVFAAVTLVAALAALRQLRLPAWWLLFPPLTEGLFALNPQILVFALLVLVADGSGRVTRSTWFATPLAALLKVYAVIPALARRDVRGLLGTGVAIVGSVAIAPGLWFDYVRSFGEISSRLASESEGGLSATLFLDPTVFGTALGGSPVAARIAGLLLVGVVVAILGLVAARTLSGAGWLAVPLVWPAAEYHYATLALPVMTPLAAWILALPTPPAYLLGLLVLAWQVLARAERDVRAAASRAPSPAPGPAAATD